MKYAIYKSIKPGELKYEPPFVHILAMTLHEIPADAVLLLKQETGPDIYCSEEYKRVFETNHIENSINSYNKTN